MNRGVRQEPRRNLVFKSLPKLLLISGIIGILAGFYGLTFQLTGWWVGFLFGSQNIALAFLMKEAD